MRTTIKERAKAFCEKNICVDCGDRKDCDRGCMGCCIPTFSVLEWLIQFGKSERAELTRWHDPNITPDDNKPVIICTSPGIYYIAAYDKQLTTGSRATARFTDTKSSAGGRFMNKTEIWKQRKQRPKGERNWRPSCFAKVIYTITICCPRPNLRGYVKGYRPFRISTESLSRGSRSTVWKLNTKINYEKTRKNRHNMRVLQTWYVVDKLTRYPNAFCKLTGKD